MTDFRHEPSFAHCRLNPTSQPKFPDRRDHGMLFPNAGVIPRLGTPTTSCFGVGFSGTPDVNGRIACRLDRGTWCLTATHSRALARSSYCLLSHRRFVVVRATPRELSSGWHAPIGTGGCCKCGDGCLHAEHGADEERRVDTEPGGDDIEGNLSVSAMLSLRFRRR